MISSKKKRKGWTPARSKGASGRESEKGREYFAHTPPYKIEFQVRTTVDFLDRPRTMTRSVTFEPGEVVDYLTVHDFDEDRVNLESPSGYIAYGVPRNNIVIRQITERRHKGQRG